MLKQAQFSAFIIGRISSAITHPCLPNHLRLDLRLEAAQGPLSISLAAREVRCHAHACIWRDGWLVDRAPG
jgi:hypothetical protein